MGVEICRLRLERTACLDLVGERRSERGEDSVFAVSGEEDNSGDKDQR